MIKNTSNLLRAARKRDVRVLYAQSEQDYRIALTAIERALDIHDSSEIIENWCKKPEKKNEN